MVAKDRHERHLGEKTTYLSRFFGDGNRDDHPEAQRPTPQDSGLQHPGCYTGIDRCIHRLNPPLFRTSLVQQPLAALLGPIRRERPSRCGARVEQRVGNPAPASQEEEVCSLLGSSPVLRAALPLDPAVSRVRPEHGALGGHYHEGLANKLE